MSGVDRVVAESQPAAIYCGGWLRNMTALHDAGSESRIIPKLAHFHPNDPGRRIRPVPKVGFAHCLSVCSEDSSWSRRLNRRCRRREASKRVGPDVCGRWGARTWHQLDQTAPGRFFDETAVIPDEGQAVH